MPVDLSQCPPEKNTRIAPPSILIWGGLLLIIFVIVAFIFLCYFSDWLSGNRYLFWCELVGVPVLIWGSAFFFRLFIWNTTRMRAEQWNETRNNYYNALVTKGRKGLDILKVISVTPDENGRDSGRLHDSLLSMRYTPQKKNFARYLIFLSTIPAYDNEDYLQKREVYLFRNKIKSVLDDLKLELFSVPETATVTVFCSLSERLHETFNTLWAETVQGLNIKHQMKYSEDFVSSLDLWLDNEETAFDGEQYLILFSAAFLTAELYDDSDLNGKTESIIGLLGKKEAEKNNAIAPACVLHRPESDYSGIENSLIWGNISAAGDLSGVVFSGLSDDEKNKITDSLINYIDKDNIPEFIDGALLFATSHPTNEMLLIQYVIQNCKSGNYLLFSKSNGPFISWSFTVTHDGDDKA